MMLDTDMSIYAIGRRYPSVLDQLARAEGRVCMSSVTYAELMFGVERSARADDNFAVLQAFTRLVPVVDFDSKAGDSHGTIKAALLRNGTPIGPLDLLIAAHARSLGLTLVTNNRREFDRVPGLKVENWVA